MKNLVMQLAKEKYDLDGIIIPHKDSLNLKEPLENKTYTWFGADMIETDLENFIQVLGMHKSSDKCEGYR